MDVQPAGMSANAAAACAAEGVPEVVVPGEHPQQRHLYLAQGTDRIVVPDQLVLVEEWPADPTQHVVRCTQHLAAVLALDGIGPSLSFEFAPHIKMGRTQLQDAVPMTLGQEFHAYGVTIGEDIDRLREMVVHLHEINMGATAIGTGINTDPRYAGLDKKDIPLTECLKDTVARVMPAWEDSIAPAIRAGKRIIISAHGNSLRALVKYLDGISDEAIVELNIPTGIPLVYELDEQLKPIGSRYLGDPDAARKAAEKVAAQAKNRP